MPVDGMITFEDRTIALAGDKSICRQFYLQFSKSLDIKYLFLMEVDHTFDSADRFFEKTRRITVMPLNNSLIIKQELLIVLCIEHAERRRYDELLYNKGLEWGTDYIDFLYVIQYYRHQYHMEWKEKNIWIFGAGNNGRCFYEKYKNTCRICGFISNYDEEIEYQGLPVIRPSAVTGEKNFYIIICSDADALMSEQLLQLGLDGRKEYGFVKTLPKKLFIAMGICQIKDVADVLCRNYSFNQQYDAQIYFENMYEPFHIADNRRLKGYGCFCDVVFYNVSNVGTKDFRDYELLIRRFYKKAFRFFMPFYFFRGQLIQATEDINRYALKTYDELGFWFRGDQEINRMLEEKASVEDIFLEISEDDYWMEEKILENFAQELKKIEILDRFSSFPIKPFIDNNYQKLVIFIDGTHFCWQLCLYLADEMAKRLHLEPMDEEARRNIKDYKMTSIMPVYPCVKKTLKIVLEDSYPFYNLKKKNLEYLNMEKYVKRYVQYVRDVQNIYTESGTVLR